MTSEAVDALVEFTATAWGSQEFARLAVSSMADDDEHMSKTARMERSSATPRGAAVQYDCSEVSMYAKPCR